MGPNQGGPGFADRPRRSETRRFAFIGVTTAQSAIMRVFPVWADRLGLGDVEICGHDLPLHAPPERYREVVQSICSDPLELGGLVTTHKIDLFEACREMFDFIDPYAQLCGEVSSLSKRGSLFRAHAKDPISSGRSLDEFVQPGYWGSSGAEAILFGAGGSNLAISLHLMAGRPVGDRPRRIVVVNRSPARLESMRAVHGQLASGVEVEYVHNSDPVRNDRLLATRVSGVPGGERDGHGQGQPGQPDHRRGRAARASPRLGAELSRGARLLAPGAAPGIEPGSGRRGRLALLRARMDVRDRRGLRRPDDPGDRRRAVRHRPSTAGFPGPRGGGSTNEVSKVTGRRVCCAWAEPVVLRGQPTASFPRLPSRVDF